MANKGMQGIRPAAVSAGDRRGHTALPAGDLKNGAWQTARGFLR